MSVRESSSTHASGGGAAAADDAANDGDPPGETSALLSGYPATGGGGTLGGGGAPPSAEGGGGDAGDDEPDLIPSSAGDGGAGMFGGSECIPDGSLPALPDVLGGDGDDERTKRRKRRGSGVIRRRPHVKHRGLVYHVAYNANAFGGHDLSDDPKRNHEIMAENRSWEGAEMKWTPLLIKGALAAVFTGFSVFVTVLAWPTMSFGPYVRAARGCARLFCFRLLPASPASLRRPARCLDLT